MSELEVRTQIYLNRNQHEALKQKAAEKSVSMAHLIREAVALYLAQTEAEADEFDLETYLDDPIWQIPEIAEALGPSGLADASVNHDSYVYGLKRPSQGEELDE